MTDYHTENYNSYGKYLIFVWLIFPENFANKSSLFTSQKNNYSQARFIIAEYTHSRPLLCIGSLHSVSGGTYQTIPPPGKLLEIKLRSLWIKKHKKKLAVPHTYSLIFINEIYFSLLCNYNVHQFAFLSICRWCCYTNRKVFLRCRGFLLRLGFDRMDFPVRPWH